MEKMTAEAEELCRVTKAMNEEDLRKFAHAKALISDTDEIAALNMVMGSCGMMIPLAHAEVIGYFEDFLEQAIEYLKEESDIENTDALMAEANTWVKETGRKEPRSACKRTK